MERIESSSQEAILNVLVAAGFLREQLERICAREDITAAQYNVLRILRGGPSEGYPRREILERMIERAPDCTRLIDRLEKRGLVQRNRTGTDRRLSLTQITPKGLKILSDLQSAFESFHRTICRRISVQDQRAISRILEQLYQS